MPCRAGSTPGCSAVDGAVRGGLRADAPASATSDLDGIEPFGFPTASRSRASTGSASAPARDEEQSRLHQPVLPRRIPARLSERIRRLHRPAPARPAARSRRHAAARRGRAGTRRPRPQRQLPRHAPVAAGRRRLLALRRPARPAATPRARAAGRSDGRPHDGRRAAGGPHRRSRSTARTIRATPSPTTPIPNGLRCPLGAHIRRSNPRNADLPPGAPASDLVARAHAGLRRRGAGATTWSPRRAFTGCCAAAANTACAPRPNDAAGLHFICLGANIARQFEFVQGAWLAGTQLRRPARRERSAARPSPARAPDGMPTDGFSMPAASGPDRRADAACRSSSPCGAAPTSSCPASARCAICRRGAAMNSNASRPAPRANTGSAAAELHQRYGHGAAAARAPLRSLRPPGLRCRAARSARAADHGADQQPAARRGPGDRRRKARCPTRRASPIRSSRASRGR